MGVEQRIGRIDRLGQHHRRIRIVNLHYEDMVETDVYRVLCNRIDCSNPSSGACSPSWARMPWTISETVLSGGRHSRQDAAELADRIRQEAQAGEKKGFDLYAVTEEDLAMPPLPASTVTMHDLDRTIGRADLMPPGTKIRPMGHRKYSLLAPGMKEPLRVTTDPDYYEENADSVEFWSPSSPLFTPPEFSATLPPIEQAS